MLQSLIKKIRHWPMCSRYSLIKTKDSIEARFGITITEPWKPRYNAAPMREMPVITHSNPKEASFFRWGFIPNWSEQESVGANLFNAKAENIFSKAPFKQAIKNQRCLILADGFYEWKREGKNKVPYRITLSSDDAFAFAGIWDSWETRDTVINTFSIITTEANSLMREIHERMPVILPKAAERDWLRKDLKEQEVKDFLIPYDSAKMSSYKAHKVVNQPDYETPECIQVAPKIYPGETYSLFE